MDAPSFLGRGWHFPPTFGDGGREVWQVSGTEDIQQSLHILLATAQGERVMLEDFGCDLRRFAFAGMDRDLGNTLAAAIKTALLRHEPRIQVETVAVERGETEGWVSIQVVYRVPSTNSRFNLVYPFYLDEGARGGP